jgi:Ca-activated chloride channel family protein
VSLPSGEVLQRMLDTYDAIRKPARILLLVDSSGVVGDEMAAAGEGRTRVEVVQEALDRGLGQLPGEAEIGLWAFPDPDDGQASHEEVVALAPLDADHRRRIIDGVAKWSTTETGERPRTPLYRAVQAAYDQFVHDGDSRSINAVVVLTDGEDRDRSARPVSLEQLVAQVDAEGARGRSAVRVFSIALPGASFPALDALSDSSNAETFPADDPDGLAEAFDAVFSRL